MEGISSRFFGLIKMTLINIPMDKSCSRGIRHEGPPPLIKGAKFKNGEENH